MKDEYGRQIDYLRISITDRCNLRCAYCMPDGVTLVPREEILRKDEFIRIARAAAGIGVRHIKVTGGEPLVRGCCTGLVSGLKKVPGIDTVTLTTNGILLAARLRDFREAGIDGINISLDTTDPEVYRQLTGGGDVSKVIESIKTSADLGIRTKVNVVTGAAEQARARMKEGASQEAFRKMPAGESRENGNSGHDEELCFDPGLLRLAEDYPVDVRFIEMMPIGYGARHRESDNRSVFRQLLERYPDMRKDQSRHGFGPAVYYRIPGFGGSIGFISAIHGRFCSSCNRVRLTSMGFFKTCLAYGDGADLRAILRDEKTGEEEKDRKLEEAMREAILRKPSGHCFDHPEKITEKHLMASIGG